MIDLRLGDCLEVMKTIEDSSIDAIITDPPYGTTNCKWDSVIDFDLMWEQLNRIIKLNGAIVLFGTEPFSSALRMSNIKNFKYDLIWDKKRPSNFPLAKYVPLKTCENIIVFSNMRATTGGKKGLETMKYYPQGLKDCNKTVTTTIKNSTGKTAKDFDSYKRQMTKTNYPKDLIYFKQESKKLHPTQKPVALMEYLIKTYTKENETVLDFTMGSGTTMLACKKLNRNGIGIEKEEKYFKIAQGRVEQSAYKLF